MHVFIHWSNSSLPLTDVHAVFFIGSLSDCLILLIQATRSSICSLVDSRPGHLLAQLLRCTHSTTRLGNYHQHPGDHIARPLIYVMPHRLYIDGRMWRSQLTDTLGIRSQWCEDVKGGDVIAGRAQVEPRTTILTPSFPSPQRDALASLRL